MNMAEMIRNQIAKGEPFYRSFTIDSSKIDTENRTVELSFSSDEPYLRRGWDKDWYEILDHAPGAVELERLNNGAPLLGDHQRTLQTGVVEKAWLDGNKGRALVRFSKNADGEREFQDVQDGIRRNVSVGYTPKEFTMEKKGAEKNDPDTWRVTKWEPLEISMVSIPADNSVGVGRSDGGISFINSSEVVTEEVSDYSGLHVFNHKSGGITMAAVPEEELENIRAKASKDEGDRVREIYALGHRHEMNEEAEAFVRDGKTADEFCRMVLEKMGAPAEKRLPPPAEIGLDKKEIKRYSFVNAIRAQMPNEEGAFFRKKAGFEIECSEAVSQQLNREAKHGGLLVPQDVMMRGLDVDPEKLLESRQLRNYLERSLNVGSSTAGGNLVATNLLASSFIDLLRNRLAIIQLGCTMLSGLVGNVAIPRQSGAGTAYWLAEGSNVTSEGDQTFDQVTLTPHELGAYTTMTRQLILQSSIDVEALVRMDLAIVLALAIDLAAISGSGSSNQPTGILNTSGIGSWQSGGGTNTNGAVPVNQDIIALETIVAAANADIGTLGYLTNTKVRGQLKQTPKVSNFPLYVWEGGETPLNEYRAAISNQVSSTLTKGSASTCSAIIFGNWRDLITGQWGTLELFVDPYTLIKSGGIQVVAFQDVDIELRHAVSFAAIQDALTTSV